MNKEQQELLYEGYGNALNELAFGDLPYTPHSPPLDTIESFIDKCKKDPEFSERWGLKIEERELSFNERVKHIVNSLKSNAPLLMEKDEKTNQWLNENNVPTKLITITYKNETIESYES